MSEHKITLTLDADVLEHVVDGKTYQTKLADISNVGLVYALRYGWQRAHNDRCGGKDKTSADKAEIQAKVNERLREGTISERATNPADPLASIRKYIREIIRRAMSDKQRKAYKAAKDKNAFVDGLFDKQPHDIRARIQTNAEKMRDSARTDLNLE